MKVKCVMSGDCRGAQHDAAPAARDMSSHFGSRASQVVLEGYRELKGSDTLNAAPPPPSPAPPPPYGIGNLDEVFEARDDRLSKGRPSATE